MTNFEKIKQMSVEELAEFICNRMCADCCDNRCPAREFCEAGCRYSGMSKWLESEADNE